ncbi:hypothetical protein H3T19_04345 [Bacteroides fragilis]|uniref:hypothetical protein n=1 Tax=Bacteroides fragilis TaxID=817 RepID=UPI0015F64DB2|nr:hypothetical protein [Bacteroides fragilis]MBA5649983.1 hypothetical protein [Bacteroides fragilis]
MKQTVEEAANDYLNRILESTDFEINFEENNYDSGARDATLDVTERAFVSGAEWQSKQSLWISVKEQLPEEDGYYFVTDGDVVEKVYFFKRWNKFVSTRDYPHLFYDEGVIKAWLPIPSFDEILEANRDVLERIKEKGD